MKRWFVVWLAFLLFMTGLGMAGGYTSGIYVRSSRMVYLGWAGAWRVGLFCAGAVITLSIVAMIFIGLIEWAGEKKGHPAKGKLLPPLPRGTGLAVRLVGWIVSLMP